MSDFDTRLPLRGKNVALIEDEALVAMFVEELLLDLGAATVGFAANVPKGLALLEREQPNFAVLDLNLGGQASYPVAEKLESANVPYLFLTGYGIDGVDLAWRSRPILQKPTTLEALRKAICAILA